MNYTDWLRRQVSCLEHAIRAHDVFDSESPATTTQLHELRKMVVLHTYLRQQLVRRESVSPCALKYDTQDYVLSER